MKAAFNIDNISALSSLTWFILKHLLTITWQ